jgi:hypothetical protein
MFCMLPAGLLKKKYIYICIFHVFENNYWKLVIVSTMVFESHRCLFPVKRYMETKSLCPGTIYCRIYYGK